MNDIDFEQLYNTYYMKVYSYVMTMAKNQDAAEEIAQKTFFRAMTAGKGYSGAGGAGEFTWLCSIAKNLFLDEVRASGRMGEMGDNAVADISIERAFVDEDSAFRIHQVLHGLDEPFKEVFSLRVFGELSFKKIGLLFGKTENWARVTHHRARLKIQERMDEQ